MRKCMLVCTALLMVAACDKQPVAPIVDNPSYNFLNNPLDGPKIWRLELGYSIAWADATNGLAVINRTFMLPASWQCGPEAALEGTDHQHLLVRPDADEWHANDMGEVWVTVRDLTQAGSCGGYLLVAEGAGKYHFLDNDVNGTVVGEKNANAFGYVVTGTLTTPAGETVHYTGQLRFVCNVQGCKTLTQSINLTR